MNQVVRVVCLLAVAAAGSLLAGCNAGRTSPEFASPQDCFQFAQQAAQDKDYLAAVDCMTEDTQEVMAGMMITAGTMMKAVAGMAAAFGGDGEETQQLQAGLQRIDAVLEKHGITDQTLAGIAQNGPFAGPLGGSGGQESNQSIDGMRAIAKPVQDHRAFVAEMIEAIDALGNDQGENPVQGFVGDLTNLHVDGDQATAMIRKQDGNESPIGFKKTAHGWRIHLDDAMLLRQQNVSTTPTL